MNFDLQVPKNEVGNLKVQYLTELKIEKEEREICTNKRDIRSA